MVKWPSFLALLIDQGSSHDIGMESDPKMIRYQVGKVPKDVGVELVVTDLEDFRETCKMMEPRLSPGLIGLVNSLDCGYVAKFSEDAAMLNDLYKEQEQEKKRHKVEEDNLDELNNVRQRSDYGNKKY